jgi:hypothetical protein
MFDKMKAGNMKFVPNLEDRFEELAEELPGDFRK